MLEAAAALRRHEISSVELTTECLSRADHFDGVLGTYLRRFDDQALDAARQADKELAGGSDRGPLHGIPIGVKDIFSTVEGPTSAQSSAFDPRSLPPGDAEAIARVRAAGAVILGKLTTMELAVGLPDASKPFPIPRNPWNTERWSGGSSSGSANGVAARMMYAAIGSDTGGSIRMPAAFCGVFGLKPTYGTVPTSGSIPLAWSLDHVGPLAVDAKDGRALLNALSTLVENPHSTISEGTRRKGSLDGVRVGIERTHHFPEGSDPSLQPAFDEAIELLRSLGAETTEVTLEYFVEATLATMVTLAAEGMALHRQTLKLRWSDFYASTRQILALGAVTSAADYVQAQRIRSAAQRALARTLSSVDVIVSPAAAVGAPSVAGLDTAALEMTWMVFTPFWNAVGNPAAVTPMGFTTDGLPLSLQIAGRSGEDSTVLLVAEAFQSASDWHLRVPPFAHFANHPESRPAIAKAMGSPSQLTLPEDPAGSRQRSAVAALLNAAALPASHEEINAYTDLFSVVQDGISALHSVALGLNDPPAQTFQAG
jgi:aspartyl-tRNA(Asn)/glutamyl-tRNA(Gln) amidotransferase subunit A